MMMMRRLPQRRDGATHDVAEKWYKLLQPQLRRIACARTEWTSRTNSSCLLRPSENGGLQPLFLLMIQNFMLHVFITFE